jgi:hypothetical protein
MPSGSWMPTPFGEAATLLQAGRLQWRGAPGCRLAASATATKVTRDLQSRRPPVRRHPPILKRECQGVDRIRIYVR